MLANTPWRICIIIIKNMYFYTELKIMSKLKCKNVNKVHIVHKDSNMFVCLYAGK